jgi:hemoglobin
MSETPESNDPEKALADCVRIFYDKAKKDPLLGPIFAAEVHDWDTHLRVVQNFWSHALLGTDRYKGHPFSAHRNLPVELAHFERWLTLFGETAKATLPPDLAAKAEAKANHMAMSFKAGLFPFIGPDGQPSRHPG